jgi:hypothetical protein
VRLAGQPAARTPPFGLAQPQLAAPSHPTAIGTVLGLGRGGVLVCRRRFVVDLLITPFSSSAAFSSSSSSSGSMAMPGALWRARATVESTLTRERSSWPRAALRRSCRRTGPRTRPVWPTVRSGRIHWTTARTARARPATGCPPGSATSHR